MTVMEHALDTFMALDENPFTTKKKHKRKMTDEAKSVIRYMCEEKPWEQYKGQSMFTLEMHTDTAKDVVANLDCLLSVFYTSTVKVGEIEFSVDSNVFFGMFVTEDKDGGAVKLDCATDACRNVFAERLPEYLDREDAWDELIRVYEE